MAVYDRMTELVEDKASLLVNACRALQTVPIYAIRLLRRDSPVVIIAPHGGRIEPGTSQIAEKIAADADSFFAFEGDMRPGKRDPNDRTPNYSKLHVTSEDYDLPLCVDLVEACDTVLAVHGARNIQELRAKDYGVYIGGRDGALKEALFNELNSTSLAGNGGRPFEIFVMINNAFDVANVPAASKINVDDVTNDRRYRNYGGLAQNNICNRGRTGAGGQLEITAGLRDALTSSAADLKTFAEAIQRAINRVRPVTPANRATMSQV